MEALWKRRRKKVGLRALEYFRKSSEKKKAGKNQSTNFKEAAPNNINIWSNDKGNIEFESEWPTKFLTDPEDPGWRTMMELDSDEVVYPTIQGRKRKKKPKRL